MKKKLLCLLFVLFAAHSVLCSATEPIVRLTTEEDRALEALYLHDSNGTLIENLNMSHIDYYLRVLPQHIKILENEYAQSSNCNIVLGFLGFMYAGIGSYFGWPLYNKIQRLMTGKFESVWIPHDMLDNLRSIRFTRSEKKKLDLVTIGINRTSLWGKTYTAAEEEKINYLGKRLALKNIKMDIFKASVISACCAIYVSLVCYDIYMGITVEHARKRLSELLDRDNRLLEFLKSEKEQRMGNGI